MSKHRTRTTRWGRLLSGVLCLALVLGLLPAAGIVQTAQATGTEHWAYPYAEQLVEWNVMKPASDLRLDDEATRAEFVAMCNRAFGYSRLDKDNMPFTDVDIRDWYYEDINIAYNAGYFQGTSANTAAPDDPLTREQAAVLLARNLMLQETVGESMGFTDSRELSEWSRGLIGAAAAEGMISGYEDGSYRPFNNITRGEVAAMLVRAIGNPISEAGNRVLGDVYGNVVISESNVTLRNTVILGNLYITGGVDLGNVLLENVTVIGRIVISGGGESEAAQSSVILRNVMADELVVDSMVNQFVTVSAYGLTNISNTYVRSDIYLEDSCTGGYGLWNIYLDGNPGTKLQLAGSIKNVVNKTPRSVLQLVKGTAETITVDEHAIGSELLVDVNTRADVVNLDVATWVHGRGDIIQLNIWADGCEVELLPAHVDIRPGITATVDGKVIGSTEASELSADPRLLSGYPTVTNLRPDQAVGQYAGNKPGTIYWAVSAVSDGSVSRENLLNPPAYGGNILKSGEIPQAGSFAADAREVSNWPINGLEPDGSYYISAILVDDRGISSPLKVFSFTTPDDTTPDFVEGYPRMSLVTCEAAQVTVMANKSCQLYWVLLPAGAAEPTAQNFRSGTFGGSYGSGTQEVVKNVPASITVNSARLQENTYYDLYLWLNDLDGSMNSAVYHVTHDSAAGTRYSFRTPDETPPVITSLMQTDYGVSDAQVSFTVSEAPVTLYWAVVADSNESFIASGADMNAMKTQLTVKSGKASIVNGSVAVADADDTFYIEPRDFKNLLDSAKYGHSFKLYCVAEDASGNFSEVRLLSIRTLDTDPPHAWLEFTDGRNGSPRADSGISIVFDEEIQGGVSAETTFLALYERVETFTNLGAGYKDQLIAAQNTLAKELAARFQLWSIPKNGGSPQQLAAKTDVNSTSDNWVIDWTQATVTKDGGNLIIALPSGSLKLDSGASYQFRLYGVYDLAQSPNAMAVDENNICVKTGGEASTANESSNSNSLPKIPFTTLYAEVEFYENADVDSIKGGNYDGYRLDTVVDIVPESTGKVPSSEVWDLIMWSDTVMTVDIYRTVLELDDDGNEVTVEGGEWALVYEGLLFSFPDAGKGLSEKKLRSEFESVLTGLEEGKIYRYGVHVTKLVVDEEDPKAEPDSWSGKIVMQFSLIAGASGNVSTVSKKVNGMEEEEKDEYYNNFVRSGDVSEIGVTREGSSILTCKPITFVDTKPPALQSTYPTFEAGSNSITIKVSLDRPGTVYYMVAPVGSINTSTDGTTLITADNDGSKGDPTSGKTYIPINGTDADTHQGYIYFKTGGTDNAPASYTLPSYLDVYNQVNKNKTGVVTGSYRVESASAVEEITVRGLDPLKTYYVYLVMKGGGDPGQIMEIYRVTTTDVIPPVIEIASVDDTSVTMTVNNLNTSTGASTLYDGSILYYALVNVNSLPDIFKEYYNWAELASGATSDNRGPYTGDSRLAAYKQLNSSATKNSDVPNTFMTVLDAMITPYPGAGGGGRTYFDVYAGEFGTLLDAGSGTLKDDIMNYISTTSTNNRFETPAYRNTTGTTTNPMPENFTSRMTDTSEYIVLACARNVQSDKGTGSLYGFAAARSLYKRDTNPPVFQPDATHPQYIMLGGATANPADATERADLAKAAWSGTFSVTFNKDVYYHDNASSTRYTLRYGGTLGTGEKLLTESGVLGGSAVSSGHVTRGQTTGTVGSTIEFKAEGIRHGETIVIFGSGLISNADNYTTNYKLTLTFDATLTYKDFGSTDDNFMNLTQPGFRVSWVEVKNSN